MYPPSASQVSTLLKRLEKQIADKNGDARDQIVQNLRYFVDQRDTADVIGLEEKLKRSQLKISYSSALERKEAFVKLLLTYQEFSSAQELFAYFLDHIYDVFEEKICPNIEDLSAVDIEKIVDDCIIDKIFSEIGCGSAAIVINRTHVRGMIYWLADKCFVRWHK
jgi:hypothetical protein